jgi:flagellar biosynthetic protein FlhB
MAEEESSDKPFEATPRKLEEARKRGEFPVSQDLVTSAVYIGILLMAFSLGAWSAMNAGSAMLPLIDTPDVIAESLFRDGGRHTITPLIWSVGIAGFVWLGFPVVAALLAAFVQGALVFAPTKLQPKISRISPISNAKQKYGPDGIFNFLKSFVKLAVFSTVLAMVFASRIDEILVMPQLPILGAMSLTADLAFRFMVAATMVVLAISTIDVFWQRAQFLRKQRMSLKEIKDETKDTEGDPHTKQARRQRAYNIATNQMLADVPNADVVLVNPEHYAVALSWTREPGSAPVCVAKGTDEIARRIREAANEHGVPIYRDAPTARALFGVVELGQEISAEHYRAVAAAIRFADAVRQKARHS